MASVAIESADFERPNSSKSGASTLGARLLAIDALRGFVMFAMLFGRWRWCCLFTNRLAGSPA